MAPGERVRACACRAGEAGEAQGAAWRAEDLELRLLLNARLLWRRYVDMIVNDTVGAGLGGWCVGVKGVSVVYVCACGCVRGCVRVCVGSRLG